MPDRIEREIEEILEKLDSAPSSRAKRPIPIGSRKPRTPGPGTRLRGSLPIRIDPTTLLFAGAALVIVGLMLASVASALIWVSFAGVVLFLGAFVLSFFRTGPRGAPAPRGHYWRNRYIEYSPQRRGPFDRFRRKSGR